MDKWTIRYIERVIYLVALVGATYTPAELTRLIYWHWGTFGFVLDFWWELPLIWIPTLIIWYGLFRYAIKGGE